MKIAGILAEYDPFHNGHAWQIAEAKRRGAQYVFVAMSSGATQRGSLPLLPEDVRARAALLVGADVVIELPAPFACSGAECFAGAGVALLAAAGCDTMVCGAETLSAAQAAAAAQVLLSPAYQEALRAALAQGARSFAAAREQAFWAAGGAAALPPVNSESEAPSLRSPNDNLCIEYAKAILRQKTEMALCTLPRIGAGHGESETYQAGNVQIASASRLRMLWSSGGAQAVLPFVPANAGALYRRAEREGAAVDAHAFDLALLSVLRAKANGGWGVPAPCPTKETFPAAVGTPFSAVRGVSEGLDCALEKAVRTAATAEELYDTLTTVRYPRARMRRLALDAALEFTAAQAMATPPYLHILGARRDALPLLAGAALPASTSLARLAQDRPVCAACAAAQSRAVDFAALCRVQPAPMGLAYTRPCVLL